MNNFLFNYGMVALGVFISLMLPVLKQYVIRPADQEATARMSPGARFWVVARPYLVTALFSLILGLLIVAAAPDTLNDWRAALLAGYAGDSTLQKLRN